MLHRTSRIVLAVALAAASTTACSPSRPEATDRWTTTENTNVKIDWDKVNDAYKHAEGPADLERRINEIYEGDEVVCEIDGIGRLVNHIVGDAAFGR